MNKCSFMEKLLEGVEVEWKALDNIFNVFAGGDVPREALSDVKTEEFSIPILSNGISEKSLYGWTDKAKIEKPSLTISARGTIGWTSYRDTPFVPIVRLLVLTPKIEINLKYAYYFMKTIENNYKIPEAGIPQLTKPMIRDIQIPIPPLHIQNKLVRILDTFTELTAELTAELIARKKQYNYYRDKLLTFEDGEVEWLTLGQVCSSISAGGDVPENYAKDQVNPTSEFPYPIFANATGAKGLYGFTDEYKINCDAVTISARGAKVGYHTVRDAKFTPIIRLIVLVAYKSIILTKYLNYALDMTPIGGTKGGIPQLTVPSVKKIKIPVPHSHDPEKSLAEQARIVAILDKFDTLTHSITEGLPREIELRQKQYEYYRNLLLSFPKSEVES